LSGSVTGSRHTARDGADEAGIGANALRVEIATCGQSLGDTRHSTWPTSVLLLTIILYIQILTTGDASELSGDQSGSSNDGEGGGAHLGGSVVRNTE